jgi:hypothetical protein
MRLEYLPSSFQDGRMSLIRSSSFSAHARWLMASLAVVGSLATAGRAEASLIVEEAEGCRDQSLEQPFVPWLDFASYVLVPGGSFSSQARSWKLAKADVVDENEPWNVHGDARPASLRVHAGGSATSPVMCVGLEHPTLRFFAKNIGSQAGPLNVDVLFDDAWGQTQVLRIAGVVGHSNWGPTLPLPIVANLLPLLPDNRTLVAFRFSSPEPSSAWLIDDVYIDPYKKG